MVNAKFQNAAGKKANDAQSGSDFRMFFAEAEKRQKFEPAVSNQGNQSNQQNDNRKSRTDETRNKEQSVRRRENTQKAEDTTNTAAVATVEATTAPAETAPVVEIPIDETQALEAVAAILQIPVEVLTEMLQQLGMEVADLTDPQAVSKLLQFALDAESPVELLTDPKFPELYKAVNEVMSNLTAQVKPNAAVNNAPVEIQAEAKPTTLIEDLDVDLEGLQIIEEDGKIVVSNNNTRENPSNNTKQQSTTEQAETQPVTEEIEIADTTLPVAEKVTVNESQVTNPAQSIETVAVKVEQAVRQAAPQQPVNTTDVIQQIMNHVKLSFSGEQFNEIRMTLRPETLGDIVLRVITQNGIVMAQFEAENQRVKEALESNFNLLRDALDEQGIKFSELSVSVRQDDNERLNQFERARQSSRRRAETIEDVSNETPEQAVSHHNGVIDIAV
jgi:flagellar hook-length control protein FliK